PKPADRAGYAAQTAPRISDSTSDSSSSPSKELMSTRTSPRKSLTTSKLSKANTTKTNTTKTRSKKLTPVLKEIRELQKSTNLLIPRAPFLRLLRELLQQRSTGIRITEMAVEALREASENVLVSVFEDSYLLALHAKRVTLMPRDISLLLRIRNDFNLLSST
ncbi:histone H3, partial [Brachionus plicatilis]